MTTTVGHPASRRDPWWSPDDDRRTPDEVLADLLDATGIKPRRLSTPAPDGPPRFVLGPDGWEAA